MDAAPKIDVIIPAWQASETIGACIESVLAQDYQEWKVILVDDGSSDGTFDVAQSYTDERIQCLQQSNQGAAAARNRGLEHATGDFIVFLDSDDLLESNKFSEQVSVAQKLPQTVLTFGAYTRFWEDGTRETNNPARGYEDMVDPLALIRHLWLENEMVQPACYLIPRRIAETIGPWNTDLTLDDDGEYFTRVLLASEAVHYVPTAKIYYRSGRTSSLAHAHNSAALRSRWLSCRAQVQAVFRHNKTNETERAAAARITRFLRDSFPLVPKCRRDAREWLEQLPAIELPAENSPRYEWIARWFGWRIARIAQRAYQAIFQA